MHSHVSDLRSGARIKLTEIPTGSRSFEGHRFIRPYYTYITSSTQYHFWGTSFRFVTSPRLGAFILIYGPAAV